MKKSVENLATSKITGYVKWEEKIVRLLLKPQIL